jgi:hypothetical protein
VLRAERLGRRDICIYPRDPHVLVARAPQELFVDPSHTYRLDFARYRAAPEVTRVSRIRPVADAEDVEGINQVYASARMLRAAPDVVLANASSEAFTYLVAEDAMTGRVVGHGHRRRPRRGVRRPRGRHQPVVPGRRPAVPAARGRARRWSARWSSSTRRAGAPTSTCRCCTTTSARSGCTSGSGFERVPVLCVKRKNPINEPLFVGPPSADYERLNPYARIIADEARRRGIGVEVLDAEWGELRLSHGGRSIVTRESLSELTSAVAMSRCDDKRITRRVVEGVGIAVPRGRTATGDDDDLAFLAELGEVVVKPARGEQGQGITVGVRTPEQLVAPWRRRAPTARTCCWRSSSTASTCGWWSSGTRWSPPRCASPPRSSATGAAPSGASSPRRAAAARPPPTASRASRSTSTPPRPCARRLRPGRRAARGRRAAWCAARRTCTRVARSTT